MRIEVEKAFANYVVKKDIKIHSEEYAQIEMLDLLPALREIHGRWNFVGPEDINCSSQPAIRSLAKLLWTLKRNKNKIPDLI